MSTLDPLFAADLKTQPQDARNFRAPFFGHNGHLGDLLNPSTVNWAWSDIAFTLAKIGRWGDRHDRNSLSVAQHCVVGADALFKEFGCHRTAGAFLLHDAHEAFLGDIVTPVMQALDALQDQDREPRGLFERPSGLMAHLKALWDVEIFTRAGLDVYFVHHEPYFSLRQVLGNRNVSEKTKEIARRVKQMDSRMAQAEAHVVFVNPALHPRPERMEELAGLVKFWGPEKAREEYEDRLSRYLGINMRETS
ncbi:MAG: hypothetical protein U5K75_08945 [Ahrensia sp.]|nr:hypothetical protein [Ahrensia sp.]